MCRNWPCLWKKLEAWRIFFNPYLCNLEPSWEVWEFTHYFCWHVSCFQRLVAELMCFCLGREETESPLVPVYTEQFSGSKHQDRAGVPVVGACRGAQEPAQTPWLPWEEDAPASNQTLCGCFICEPWVFWAPVSVFAIKMCHLLNSGD